MEPTKIVEFSVERNEFSYYHATTKVHQLNLKAFLVYINIYGRFKTARHWVKTYCRYPLDIYQVAYVLNFPKKQKRIEFDITAWKVFWAGWCYYYKDATTCRTSTICNPPVGGEITITDFNNAVKEEPINYKEVMAQLCRLAESEEGQLLLEQNKKATNIVT